MDGEILGEIAYDLIVRTTILRDRRFDASYVPANSYRRNFEGRIPSRLHANLGFNTQGRLRRNEPMPKCQHVRPSKYDLVNRKLDAVDCDTISIVEQIGIRKAN